MNLTFSTPVCEAINYYVYILIDPRDEKIFYIGKGVNNRIFNHVNDSLTNTLTSDKLNLIREIINENKNVIHLILRHGLTEKEALIVESSCMYITIEKYTIFQLKSIPVLIVCEDKKSYLNAG